MKISVFLIAMQLLIAFQPIGHAEEYGKIRALQQRKDFVIRQKNDYVAKVLAAYAIPHERNSQGIVVRINRDGLWWDVTAIEIVPVQSDAVGKGSTVTVHELLFYTSQGTLDLLSDLPIR